MIKKLLLLVFLVVGALVVSAQTISGTVTDLNGSVIANQQVYISNYDSTNNYSSQTFTNNLGIYTFSNVPASAMGFSVYTKDCQNQISAINVYTNSGIANFTICTTTITCSAAFYSNPDSNIVNTINFIDNSTGNPTSWLWNFGDGTTSNLQNPSHTYASSGTYGVLLFITSANCSDSIYTNVIVGNSTVSCAANFYSYADSNNVNLINFVDNSTGNPTSWLWNFGDGTTSTLQNPSHTYANFGSYNVTLNISGNNCSSSFSKTVVISGPTTYAIHGYVFANNIYLQQGQATVELFDVVSNTVINTLNTDTAGSYYFNNVTQGDYKIRVSPNALQGFAPTYYGDVVLWSSASTINVNSDMYNLDINLNPIVVTPGANSVNGNVGTGSKASVANLNVYLIDISDDKVVATTLTDINGDFNLQNISDGTYNLWIEVAGKVSTPIMLTLNANNSNSIDNDFIVDENTITPSTVSISDNNIVGNLSLYPNPVTSNLNVLLEIENESKFSFEIYSISGKLVHSQYLNVNSGITVNTIDVNSLAQGSYILIIKNDNNNTIQKLFVK